ncbi:hypothetical protein FPOAC2_00462 [Fusarium poae]
MECFHLFASGEYSTGVKIPFIKTTRENNADHLSTAILGPHALMLPEPRPSLATCARTSHKLSVSGTGDLCRKAKQNYGNAGDYTRHGELNTGCLVLAALQTIAQSTVKYHVCWSRRPSFTTCSVHQTIPVMFDQGKCFC